MADIVNATISGALISGNLFLQSTMNKVILVLLALVIVTLVLYVVWNRYRA